jgi:putative transposase
VLAEKAHFEVRRTCRVLGIAASRYYEWERKRHSERAVQDGALLVSTRRIFAKFRSRYGAPRVHDQLGREGMHVSRKRVARLMREAGLRAKGRRKYKATTDSNHALPVAPNLLERDFQASRPPPCGSATSRTSGRARAGCTWRSSWTCTRARSWAGAWPSA